MLLLRKFLEQFSCFCLNWSTTRILNEIDPFTYKVTFWSWIRNKGHMTNTIEDFRDFFLLKSIILRVPQNLKNQPYWFDVHYLSKLEIKPCGLGPTIQDVEAFWYKTEIKTIYFVPLCLIVFDCMVYPDPNFFIFKTKHYHLEGQANSKKKLQKTRCYF